jgi:hypothetical protein
MPGSTHNHQAWAGGCLDHVTEAHLLVGAVEQRLVADENLPRMRPSGEGGAGGLGAFVGDGSPAPGCTELPGATPSSSVAS